MATGKIKTLFSDKEKTEALFPRTKIDAVSDSNGVGLNVLMEHLAYTDTEDVEASTAPVDADSLGGLPAENYATQAFVTNKIAEAQLDSGDGGDIDLSGYATKDDLNSIDYPVDSVNGKTGAVTLGASDVGAAPADAVINNNAQRRDNYIADVLNVDLNNPDSTANRSGYFDTSSVNIPSSEVAFGIRDVYFANVGFVIVEARCYMHDNRSKIWRNTYNQNAGGWIGWESLDKSDFLSVNGGHMKDGAYIDFFAPNTGITWQYDNENYVLRPLADLGLELLANNGNGYYVPFRVKPDGKLELGNTEIADIKVSDSESNGYVHIHNDGEGGTVLIASPNNTYHYEFDAYNDRHLRIHTADKNPNGNAKFWTFMGDSGEFHSESISTTNPIAVQYGGTGAANAESARANLGAAAESDLKRRRIYVANGMFLNDATATGEGIRGTGSATINIEPNGIARIDFVLKIEEPPVDGNGNESNYGINRDMLQLINPNIPMITPIGGGVCTIYNDDGTINADLNGYGAAFGTNGGFWVPGRVYQREQGETSYIGVFGWWPQRVFAQNMRIVGTCYGTVD